MTALTGTVIALAVVAAVSAFPLLASPARPCVNLISGLPLYGRPPVVRRKVRAWPYDRLSSRAHHPTMPLSAAHHGQGFRSLWHTRASQSGPLISTKDPHWLFLSPPRLLLTTHFFLLPAPYDRLTCTPFQNAMCPLILAAAALGASYTHAAFAFVAPSTVTFLYVAVPFHGHTEVWAEGVKWAATRESGGKYTYKRGNGRGQKNVQSKTNPPRALNRGNGQKGSATRTVDSRSSLSFPSSPSPSDQTPPSPPLFACPGSGVHQAAGTYIPFDRLKLVRLGNHHPLPRRRRHARPRPTVRSATADRPRDEQTP